LEDLRSDDSRKVSAAAEAVLATLFQQDEAAAAAAAREADRIRTKAEQLVVEASERLARQDLPGALTAVEAAQQLDPSSSTAATLRDQIQLAIEEARRKEELERQMHERRQKVAALIGRANQVTSHEAAIEALNEALDLDPGHEVASRLLARHTAALEQMAAERARL
jgi:tetratricopeptide (TPR) repeat protein